jgi:hypothetical protein
MPQFGTRSLLLVFAAAALWLSTINGYEAASDVRRSVMLVILLAALFSAVYFRERRRSFWSGFFIVMLISSLSGGIRQYFLYFPSLGWRNDIIQQWLVYDEATAPLFEAATATLREAVNLLLAGL